MILPYFPAPYPDELLYSLLARYHRHTCSTSPKQTLEDLFGSRNVRATVDLPGHLAALSSHLPPDRRLTPERLAAEFTLFPYYVAFQPPMVVASVHSALIGGRAGSIHMHLGITASTVAAPTALRYCPTCHTEALTRWGERFWRRAHQLPGVVVCPDHGVPLVDSSVVPGLGHQHEFIAADEQTCRSKFASPACVDHGGCGTILVEIAMRSAVLLNRQPQGVDPADLTAQYRNAMIDRQLASASGRVDQRRLHATFVAVFASTHSMLPELQDTAWLTSIVRKHGHAFHPLHHILFSLLLDRCTPLPEIVRPTLRRIVATTEFKNRLRDLVSQGAGLRATARALAVDTNTIRLHVAKLSLDTPWRPLARSRAAPKDDPRPSIRERWLELQRQEPQLGRKGLARQLPAEHIWLYRHDRVWLDVHSPATLTRSLPAIRVDWAAVDHNLATALRESAELVRYLSPPVRITLAELERRLGRSGWIEKRRRKLPKTLAVLAYAVESVETFQLRRIAWAKEALEGSEGSASAWKVHRLAKLPSRTSAAVRQALVSVTPTNDPSVSCR